MIGLAARFILVVLIVVIVVVYIAIKRGQRRSG